MSIKIKVKISQSKKEIENFIWAKLRIITWEQPLRKLWELFQPLEVKAQLYKFFETEGCTLNKPIIDSLHNPDLQVQSGGSWWALTRLGKNVIFKGLSCWC